MIMLVSWSVKIVDSTDSLFKSVHATVRGFQGIHAWHSNTYLGYMTKLSSDQIFSVPRIKAN